MAAIKLFGATILIECPVREDHDHGRTTSKVTMMTTSKVTMMTTATTSSSTSSSSDQGAAVEHTKKPDKIIPCPRCKSMETKFCYFNNYNVNQPRHFCKGCQRYWTAGGALRNVPIGAGRRKSKPPTPTPHPPCRTTGDGMYVDGDLGYGVVEDDGEEDWRVVEQGSLPLQHIVRIKRRRTDFHTDHNQCY